MSSVTTETAEAFADHVLRSALGLVDTLAVYLGDRLGWYRSLASDGPATPVELAARTGTNARYAREWLEQQAVSGFLSVTEPGGMPRGADRADSRVYHLSPTAAEVLTDEHSLNYLAPLARMFAATGPALPACWRHTARVAG